MSRVVKNAHHHATRTPHLLIQKGGRAANEKAKRRMKDAQIRPRVPKNWGMTRPRKNPPHSADAEMQNETSPRETQTTTNNSLQLTQVSFAN